MTVSLSSTFSSTVIESKGLYKSFRHYHKEAGLLGSLKSLYQRQYTDRMAVSPFDFKIERGEIVALLGPNGAGKTTLMKMMTGIIVPSGGELRVLNHTPWMREKDFRRKVALVMGQKSQLWWDIPAMDSFQLLQAYYEIPVHEFKKRVGQLAELLEVQHILNVHVRKLSLGERMKMEVMASLLHKPEVIFLDEPTIGLDIVAQKNIRQFLKDYHREEKPTIILTSHYMADVEALCSRLILVINGEKSFDGDLTDFSKILGHEKNVSFNFQHPQLQIKANNNEEWRWAQYDAQWSSDGLEVNLRIPENELREASAYIISHYPVVDFNTDKMPIERVLHTFFEKKNHSLLKVEGKGIGKGQEKGRSSWGQ